MTASRAPACPVCQSATRPVFCFQSVRHFRCTQCALYFYHPFPDDDALESIYEREWSGDQSRYRTYYDDPEFEARNMRLNFHVRLDLLEELGFDGRILDVGCSTGNFLKAAVNRGWEAEGIEIAQAAASRAAAATGCPVHHGTLTGTPLPAGRFDAVHASHVIEHVRAPGELIAAARRVLRPGGCLVLALPIISERLARVTAPMQQAIPFISRGRTPPYPWAIEYPHHLMAHSPASIRKLLDDHGLRVVKIRNVLWQNHVIHGLKWRAFYSCMNGLARICRTGLNVEVYAVDA